MLFYHLTLCSSDIFFYLCCDPHMFDKKLHARIQRGDRGPGPPPPPPLKNHKNIGFLSNTGPDPLKNHKTTKPAFNVGPSSARQRNATKMAFCWQADDDLLIVVFGSSLLLSLKKVVKVGPPLMKLSESAHELYSLCQ